MIRRSWIAIGAVVALGLVTVSCSSGERTVGTTPGSDTSETPASSTTPSGSEGSAAPASEPTAGSAATSDRVPVDQLFLPAASLGLDALTSYHQTYTLTVSGSAADAVDTATRDAWPNVGNVTVITSTRGAETTELLVGAVNGTTFVRHGAAERCDVQWNPAGTTTPTPFEPAALLPPVVSATPAGTAEHDGIAVDRYTFDARIGAASGSGELQLAAGTGVLVSYVLDLVDGSVTQRYRYEVTAIDALPAPGLPGGCTPVLESVPAVDGATNVQRLANMLDYATTLGVGEVVAFYTQAMPTLGWTLEGTTAGDPARQTSIYANASTGESASILVEAADGRTWVNVLVRTASTAG